eukprot:5668058-Prymnesium_polylepis.1
MGGGALGTAEQAKAHDQEQPSTQGGQSNKAANDTTKAQEQRGGASDKEPGGRLGKGVADGKARVGSVSARSGSNDGQQGIDDAISRIRKSIYAEMHRRGVPAGAARAVNIIGSSRSQYQCLGPQDRSLTSEQPDTQDARMKEAENETAEAQDERSSASNKRGGQSSSDDEEFDDGNSDKDPKRTRKASTDVTERSCSESSERAQGQS